MEDGIQVRFEGQQLHGFYRFGAYGDMVSHVGNQEIDTAYVKSRLMTPSRDITDQNGIDLLLLDAAQSIAEFGAYLNSNKIDTKSPKQWGLLIDCIACSNRLMIVPNYKAFGIPVYRYIMDVAMFIDMYGRSCDSAYSDQVSWKSTDEVMQRSRHIFIDIMCGRGGMWMEWAYDLGCEAATAMGLSFVDTYNNHCDLRYATLDGTFSERFGEGSLLKSIRFVAKQFDMLQAAEFDRVHAGEPYELGSYKRPVTYMDVLLSPLCADLEAHVFVTGDCRGYCTVSSRNACNTVMMLRGDKWYAEEFVLPYEAA